MLDQQSALIASLKTQPLIVVLRPNYQDLTSPIGNSSLFSLVEELHSKGLKHIEIACSPTPGWSSFIKNLLASFKNISFGAASVSTIEALQTVRDLKLSYAMTPFWDTVLQQKAKDIDQLLIPGVFSPSEIHMANSFGCEIIKLYPAASLGMSYLSQLKAPFEKLPFIIAAGGLTVSDVTPWLKEGFDAIALGRGLLKQGQLDSELEAWLNSYEIDSNLDHLLT